MITDYGRDWFRTVRQRARIARSYDASYFDGGCVEIVEEKVYCKGKSS